MTDSQGSNHHPPVRDLVDSLNVGIWMVDSDGMGVYANPRMAEMLGVPADEVLDRRLLDFFAPADHSTVVTHMNQRRFGRADAYDARLVRADGSVLSVRVQGSPVRSAGEFIVSVAAITDLSDLVEAAEGRDAALAEAEASNLTKSRFLSWLSHELRTPLNTISGFAQLLESGLTNPAQQDMVRSILTATSHVNSLVQDLLDYSKADANVLDPNLTPVDLGNAIADAVGLVSGTAHDLDVSFEIDVADGPLTALADRRHLVQVLVNLLSNAVKYGGRSRTVHVRAAAEGDSVVCSVTDEGPGIAPELQRRAFRPFERLDNAEGVIGAGLGLSIAESFMRAMRGTLTLSSPAGEGATFTLQLQQSHEADTTVPDPEPATRLVLYVEDEPLNASLVSSIIGMLPGRELRVEPTVAGGIDAAATCHPALILLDLNLPDGSGFDVLTAVRNDPSTAHVPVFVLSADATEQATQRARELGADRFISKPFNLKEFIELVESVT